MLDNESAVKEIDRQSMYKILEAFPRQCTDAHEASRSLPFPQGLSGRIRTMIVCGQGGSAIGGEILQNLLFGTSRTPVILNRTYYLPRIADQHALVVLISYSGNTEETLAAYQEARTRKCTLFCVSSGGTLGQMATRDGVPWIKVPGGMPPRTCLGYLFIPLLRLAEQLHLTESQDYDYLREELQVLRDQYRLITPESNNPAKQLSRQLQRVIPLVYGVEGSSGVAAHRWKTQFNENSKRFAFWDVLPELNHNEVVPWAESTSADASRFHVVVLGAPDLHPQIRRRIEVTTTLIRARGAHVSSWWPKQKTQVAAVLAAVYLGDWVSFYSAILGKVDPTPIAGIVHLKQELART